MLRRCTVPSAGRCYAVDGPCPDDCLLRKGLLHMIFHSREEKPKRTSIARTTLEQQLLETARSSAPECSELASVIVERVVPATRGGPNWAVKGVRYGKADRGKCAARLSSIVAEQQQEFDLAEDH
jgi:hypothetical protein